MRDVVIIGAGGHGREAVDIVDAMNSVRTRYRLLGFIDDGRDKGSEASPHNLRILGNVSDLEHMDTEYIPAVGDPSARQAIVNRLPNHRPLDAIHPSATIGSHVEFGPGLIMAAGARITHSVRIGAHVHLNINSTVSHDCIIGDFVTITPGANVSGGVRIGDRVWIGVGAAVIQSVNVGNDVTIGAGAALIKDAPAGTTQVGVPTRTLREGQDSGEHN